MTRSGGKTGSRQGHAQRKELFSAEDLSLQWREVRKAVSGGGAGLVGWANCLPASARLPCLCRIGTTADEAGQRLASSQLQPGAGCRHPPCSL
jgi:hypothetical protein